MLRTIGMNNNKYKPAAAHQNFYCVMEKNGNAKEDLKDMVEREMEERFGWLRIMLQLTGLMYFTEERPIWRRLKIARATILISLAIYQLLFVLKILLNHGKFDLLNSRSLIIFSWIFQAVISMGFLIYYQWNRQICRLRDVIYCQNGCPKTPKVIKSTIIFTCTLLLITCVSILLVIILQDQGWFKANSVLDDTLYLMYGEKLFFPLTLFIFFWAMYVWTSALTFFICIVTALNHELCVFNHLKLMKIGDEVEEGDMDGIGNELQECYVHHVSLANRVRVINDTFEVYTFTLLGCNVPTTIFCLLSFLLSLSHQNFNLLHILISVPDLLFCLFELIGLTSSPAKVHATIRDVESIIYRNMRIWKPYNEKVYRLASVFIAHANQSNLGITLWGFAVVTKPLILTMISLTISYLTFVLQVRPEKSAGGNETLHFSFN